MPIDIFYTQPFGSPYKIVWLLIFGPAIAGVMVYVFKTWRTHTWLPLLALILLLAGHVAYSATAGHLIASRQSVERWYAPIATRSDPWSAPKAHSSDAPRFPPTPAEAWRFTDDPTPPRSR